MHQTVKSSFWIVKAKKNKTRKCPIYLRIKLGDSISMLSTGYYVLPSQWDKRQKRLKGNSNENLVVNQALSSLKTEVLKTVHQLQLEGRQVNSHILKDRLKGKDKKTHTLLKAYKDYLKHMKELVGTEYTQPTLIKYKNTHIRLKEFIRKDCGRNDIHLFELNYDFMQRFIDFLKTAYGNSQTTCYKHYQRFTKVVRVLMRKGYIDKYPFEGYQIKLPKKKVQFLTIEEINQIENTEFEIDRLTQIKDMFIFSCYTGLAFKEVENLSPDHLYHDQGEVWIELVRQKTQKDFKIPLLPKAIEILEKYKDHPICIKRNRCLPVPSNQKFNAYLKEIGEIAGIKKKLHHHLARKSYSVSIVLRNSVPIETLSLLLGHSSIKVTVDAYSAITDDKIRNDFRKLKDNLYKENNTPQ